MRNVMMLIGIVLAVLIAAAAWLWTVNANRLEYFYDWGSVGAVKAQTGSRWDWSFGVLRIAPPDRRSIPAVVVHIESDRRLIAEVVEQQLLSAHAESRQTSDDLIAYWIGSSIFYFRDGVLVEWAVGPSWGAKSGLYYSREMDTERHQFPLQEPEVRDLFGAPRRTERKLEIN